MSAKTLPGARRAAFRTAVGHRLVDMGFKRSHYEWISTSQLVVIINGELRSFPLNCNMGKARLEFQLGRLSTWAELLDLGPQPVPADVRALMPTSSPQLDLIALAQGRA